MTINGVASGGEPDDANCTLANPSSFPAPGVIAFEAPSGEGSCPQLAAETTYFVVIEWLNPSGTASFALIPQTYPSEETAATAEDLGGTVGWSIADRAYYLSVSSDARTWAAYAETASFKIEVKQAAVTAARANTASTGLPAILGTTQVGETLTADTSAIDDEDGLTNVSYEYQWLADGADIDGATGSNYELTSGELGKTVQVRVSFTDDAENEETLTSVATVAVAARANTAPTGLPTISDTPQVGETLTADTSSIDDEDGLTNVAYEYQWIAGGTDIDAATGSSYELTYGELGKTIQVRVSFTDDAENEETLTSVATVAVAAKANTAPTGLPIISGTPQVDQTLTADTSAITDEDGLDDVSYSYQWLAGGTDIDGATGSTYELTSSELGKTIQVRVTFTDDAENEETLTSVATVAVLPAGPSLNVTDGEATEGDDATLDFLVTLDPAASTEVTVDYATQDGTATASSDYTATSGTLAFAAGDTTKTVSVPIQADTDEDGGETFKLLLSNASGAEIADAEATGTINDAAAANNAPTGLPAISGTPQVDQTLTADTSEIEDTDGLTNVSYEYQWTASGTDIDGATGSTHTLTHGELGKTIQLRVTFTDDQGNEETLSSEATVAVAAAPNRPATGAPSIRGVLQALATVTADTVGVADADGLESATISYQWHRVADGDASDIAGATKSTYTLTSADVGDGIQLHISFTDDRHNAESMTSAVTAPVVASEATRELLWLSTMTPEDPDGLDTDFLFSPVANQGSLKPAAFTDGDDTREIAFLFVSLGSDTTLALELDAEPTTAQIATWRLTLHNAELAFADAPLTQTGASPPSHRFQWDVAGLAVDDRALWDDGEEFTVSLLKAINLAATGVPTISGTPQVNESLNAAITEIADGNGLDSATYEYQWTAGGSDIDGATGSSFTLTSGQEGQTIQVRVSFTDDDGFSETAISVATDPVAAAEGTNNAPTGRPAIGGTPQVDQTLTADTSPIDDQDGLTNVSYEYQWLADGTDIDGATGSAYTLTHSELGKTIQVRVTFTDDADNDETLTSAATDAVAAAPNREATGVPTVSGTPQVEETLTADTSSIDDADGLTNVSFRYQWMAGGTDIVGATGSSYTLTASEQGKTIQVRVDFTDDRNNAETLTSAATDPVAAKPAPLTATFSNVPDSHDGSGFFTFDLAFSENFPLSYRTLRDHAFIEDDHGPVTKAQRKVQGSNQTWTITVEPSGNGAITITLPATTDCDATGAICTDDGRMLSNSLTLTVSGPGQ